MKRQISQNFNAFVIGVSLIFGLLLIAYVRMPWPKIEGKSPFYARLHTAIGVNLARYTTAEGALEEFKHAMLLDPTYTDAANHLANTLFQIGRIDEAIQTYRETLVLDPKHPDANNNLGLALLLSGKAEESVHFFGASLQHRPQSADVRSNLGAAYMQLGKLDEAEEELRSALELNVGINALHNLALCLFRKGRASEAAQAYERALKQAPLHLDSLTELSWLLSTSADDAVRDGNKALVLAQKAMAICQYPPARVLRSLAAAFAETGDFLQAERYAVQAMELARSNGDEVYAIQVAQQIESYGKGMPWRESTPNP